MVPSLSKKHRLMIIIGLSFSFFCAEISVGFYTKSIALVADAFHYMNDLISFLIALTALLISTRASPSPAPLSFGWQRAQLLGAFFNGVFLLALGVSIMLQSIERFVAVQRVTEPKLMLIMGGVGLGTNLVSALFLHEHDHGVDHDHGHGGGTGGGEGDAVEMEGVGEMRPHSEHRHKVTPKKGKGFWGGRDLGMMAVLVHVLGDAINNIGVIAAALVIWLGRWEGRYYADPGVSMGIAFMILASSIPLVRNSGTILLQSAPAGVDPEDVKHDLERIEGIASVHELHVWRLNQKKSIASAHVVMSDPSMENFMKKARTVTECLHAYGIHSATLQPELAVQVQTDTGNVRQTQESGTGHVRLRSVEMKPCQIPCGNLCEELTCCG